MVGVAKRRGVDSGGANDVSLGSWNPEKGGGGSRPERVKNEFLRLVSDGATFSEAMRQVGRDRSALARWKKDKFFASRLAKAVEVRSLARQGISRSFEVVPEFKDFSERFLRQRLFPHQLQWVDALEGREPQGLHPSMFFTQGKKSRVMINTPPGHAKSTTMTVNYVVWRIIANPNVKVVVVSKSQRLAEQFLLQIKERLTSPEYSEMQLQFGPPGGFDSDSAGWSAARFYISSKVRGAEAKDPTVQALGMRGQLYGSRADLIVVDDAVDNTNVADYDRQIAWLLGIVASRLAPRTGKLLVIGTRIAATDLYSELQDANRYFGGKSPWTYLKQPAVLEYADDPKDWVTLWPKSDAPADPDEVPDDEGLYRRWDGETLAEVRDGLPANEWSRIYQQDQVSEDSFFTPEMIADATRGSGPGRIPDTTTGRDGGMRGLKMIAGLDPATAGYTAAVLLGFDRYTGERWVVDVHNEAGMRPDAIRNLIKGWTSRYAIHEWRIEKNAFQAFLTQDTEIREYLAQQGCLLTDHTTSAHNKHDPEFGVAAMSMLFETNLISLPQPRTEAVRAMREQLLTWQPDMAKNKNTLRGIKTDIVMAMWFAEIRCQELFTGASDALHSSSPFLTRRDVGRQRVVSAHEFDEPIRWG